MKNDRNIFVDRIVTERNMAKRHYLKLVLLCKFRGSSKFVSKIGGSRQFVLKEVDIDNIFILKNCIVRSIRNSIVKIYYSDI